MKRTTIMLLSLASMMIAIAGTGCGHSDTATKNALDQQRAGVMGGMAPAAVLQKDAAARTTGSQNTRTAMQEAQATATARAQSKGKPK